MTGCVYCWRPISIKHKYNGAIVSRKSGGKCWGPDDIVSIILDRNKWIIAFYLNDDDVKIRKRLNLSSRKLRGFEPGKIGPKDGKDFIGGNYAYSVNLEANLPNFFPEKSS